MRCYERRIELLRGNNDFDEIWGKLVFEKIFDTYFPLSAIVDVDGVETTFKVRGVKHISLNISEMIEDNNFSTN